MTPAQAIAELRTLRPMAQVPSFPPDDIELRNQLIAVIEGIKQDRSYVLARNKLVGPAWEYASILTNGTPEPERDQARVRMFLARMNELGKGIPR